MPQHRSRSQSIREGGSEDGQWKWQRLVGWIGEEEVGLDNSQLG